MKQRRQQKFGVSPNAFDVRAENRTVIERPRHLKGAESLHGLLLLADGITAWTDQFQLDSPVTAVAASGVGHDGVAEVLAFVGTELDRLAPIRDTAQLEEASGGTKPDRQARDDRRQLVRTVNYFDFLREAVAEQKQVLPDYEYPYENLEANPDWHESWEPAGEEAALLTDRWFWGRDQLDEGRRAEQRVQLIHERIGIVAREVVAGFLEELAGTGCRFSFKNILAQLDNKPSPAAKAACKKFEKLTRQLHAIICSPDTDRASFPFGAAHQVFMIDELVEKFFVAGQRYADRCLESLPISRSARQNERNKLLRRIGIVTQYAYLASGNSRYLRFRELVGQLGKFAEILRADVLAVLQPTVALPDQPEARQALVRQLNGLIVEPSVRKRWRAILGGDSGRVGKMIEAIVSDSPLQESPWTPGDKVAAISKQGLLRRRGRKRDAKSEEVREKLFLMQHAGLAIQAPWSYILGEVSDLPRRRNRSGDSFEHKGLPWFINPLGAVLSGKTRGRNPGKAPSQKKSPSRTAAGKKRVAKANKAGRRKTAKKRGESVGSLALMAKRRPSKP